jgi:hypothetical protein
MVTLLAGWWSKEIRSLALRLDFRKVEKALRL